jgi:hypothetical protein
MFGGGAGSNSSIVVSSCAASDGVLVEAIAIAQRHCEGVALARLEAGKPHALDVGVGEELPAASRGAHVAVGSLPEATRPAPAELDLAWGFSADDGQVFGVRDVPDCARGVETIDTFDPT